MVHPLALLENAAMADATIDLHPNAKILPARRRPSRSVLV
jgi:hypothetical protein